MEIKERMIEKYKEVEVKECLHIAGDSNKYQVILIFFFASFAFFLGFQYYMFPYIFYEPGYECLTNGKYVSCTEELACSEGITFRTKSGILHFEIFIIFKLKDYRSIINEFGFVCSKRSNGLTFQFLILTIAAFSNLPISISTDIFGRKKSVLILLM